MSGEASGFSVNVHFAYHALSVSPLSKGLQTAYLVTSLLVAVGCGLLLIYLVWNKEYLQKPRHYLRCNLAVDDIIFTGYMIPVEICRIFSRDNSNDDLYCWLQWLMVSWSITSMFGTYLMMAVELYYFICHSLHYHDKVTTKRVIVGIVAVRSFALLAGAGPTVANKLQNLPCVPEPIRNAGAVPVILVIFVLYFLVFREARIQQQRDEGRSLWLYQTKAFKTIGPHIIVLATQAVTILFVAVSAWAFLNNADAEKAPDSLLTAVGVAKLLVLTVSSMVNPIVYSFRQPEFRRALRELFNRPANIPTAPAPPIVQRGQNIQMAIFSVPDHGQGASCRESTSAPPPPQEDGQYGEEAPHSQAQTQVTRDDMKPGQAPLPKHCKQDMTLSSRPMLLAVRVEVHQNGPPLIPCSDQEMVTPTSEDVDIISLSGDVVTKKNPRLQPRTAWHDIIPQVNPENKEDEEWLV
ncbi:olfactory receptor 6M1-like [Branchiostoma lanceolatum]|uniref:olfactory receptor 6M1-like n=1 Tax=Branchiostoma lanceolatum TaxID=7740 RepID=UPI0034545555